MGRGSPGHLAEDPYKVHDSDDSSSQAVNDAVVELAPRHWTCKSGQANGNLSWHCCG